jgi:DNA mismatch repair protein MutS
MAQMGSFVPAEEAVVGIVDQIFTRIGAGDNLARGQSTFLLEMQEAAAILHNYTPQSLLILDEIGRGTSTYDGMSIAWSFVEYLSSVKRKAPRTLFATHYHELTELARRRGVHNLNLLVEESEQGIRFLRRVVPGAADRSYGIHVAQLAGIPKTIIQRAYELLAHLEKGPGEDQPSLFEALQKEESEQGLEPPSKDTPSWTQAECEDEAARSLVHEIAEIDINQLSPMEALKLIAEWQEEYASPGQG